jgi:hypothetical protein
MPRPYYPHRAGPYAPAWHPDAAEGRPFESEPRTRTELEAEIERLRAELAQLPQEEGGSQRKTNDAHRARTMLWCALGLCAAALLFTIIAIQYHG